MSGYTTLDVETRGALFRIAAALERIAANGEHKVGEVNEQQDLTIPTITSQWRALGASTGVAHAFARNGILPDEARTMSDREIRHLRQIGPKGLAQVHRILGRT
jgi:hypothetical protein